MLSAAAANAGPRDLPAPTGPFPVGRRVLHWSRPDTLSPTGGSYRELTVYVWYPAQASTQPRAPYVDALDRLSNTLSRTEVTLAKSTITPLPGATHATFSDEEVLTTNTAAQRALLERVRTFIVQFFDETLRDAAPAIGRATPPNQQVRIDVFSPP